MRITITTPSITNPHGGLRILNEWAERLGKWHEVTLFVQNGSINCDWYDMSQIRRTKDTSCLSKNDCLIIGSPHGVDLQRYARNKCFIFLQMMEHMFNPNNIAFKRQCEKLYKSPNPLISISKWNIEKLKTQFGRKGPTYYVGNGVNFDHFPIERVKKDKIVLVEGWEAGNVTKDVDAIGPRVAARLKREGYKVLAYSQKPLTRHANAVNEYHRQPSLEVLNDLYRRAKILIKATKYDARSTAPMEAMTKGTPTVRGIIRGDDDLQDNVNCLRSDYNEAELYQTAKFLLENDKVYEEMSENCLEYVQKYDWDYWMERINNILCMT